MAKNTDYFQILLIMASFSFLSFFGCRKSGTTNGHSVEHGSFTITSRTQTSSRYDINTASRRKNTITKYKVQFGGKPLPLPAEAAYDNLWKVYILSEAPKPSLLTIGRSAYLWSEKEGQLESTPLLPHGDDFLTLQPIGASPEMMQPQWTIYRTDDRDASLELKGSSHLLIGQEKLLRLSDLTLFSIPRMKRLVDDFYPHTSNGAQGLSPDEQQIVLIGSKSDEVDRMRYNYGLMIYPLKDGAPYVLPIDQNSTRLPEYELINPDWFRTYYDWEKLTDGGYRLVARQLDQAPFWQGWFRDPGDKRFSLKPVSEELLPHFGEFVKEKLALSPDAIQEEHTESFEYLKFVHEDKRFTISYWAEGEQLSFSVDLLERGNEVTDEVITSIGKAFNQELANGNYQNYFTSL